MKALVVGGSSGIGLAIVKELLNRKVEKVYIVSKENPDYSTFDDDFRILFEKKTSIICHNLADYDDRIFDNIDDIDLLFITAGFGRVARFEDLKKTEVKNLLRVNLEGPSRIIKHYYEKIRGSDDFYTCVLVSICAFR